MAESCIVVGAGISGLLAARELTDAGWRVVVLDKGRGVGGRMATRRVGGATFDHGAQFFTARSDRFQELANGWLEAGFASEWSRGFAGADGERPPDGHPRYRGASGMTSIPKSLSEGLDVRTDERVSIVNRTATGWEIKTRSGLEESADALLMTPPVPQSLAVLGGLASDRTRERLAPVRYAPCFALMASLSEPLDLPEPGGVQIKGEPLDWISDNRRKGISDVPALTIHAGPEWSRIHVNDDEASVTEEILGFAGDFLGIELRDLTTETSLARWRYSMVVQSYPERFLVGSERPPLVFCGDAFGEAKVEGASLSALAAADWLLGRDG